jgi:hypothetical protein
LQPVDEGAEVALKTVDTHANNMRKILFVLKDDHIYDAWVKKAKELKFSSPDDIDTRTTSASAQSTTNTQKPIENPSSGDDPKLSRKFTNMNVTDASTPDNPDETRDATRAKSPEKPPPTPVEEVTKPETEQDVENNSTSDKDKDATNKKRYVINTAE